MQWEKGTQISISESSNSTVFSKVVSIPPSFIFIETSSPVSRDSNPQVVSINGEISKSIGTFNPSYIEKYADLLNLDYIGTESRYMKYGITKESAGNTVQIYNWFVEVIEDILIDIQFPEWAQTPGVL